MRVGWIGVLVCVGCSLISDADRYERNRGDARILPRDAALDGPGADALTSCAPPCEQEQFCIEENETYRCAECIEDPDCTEGQEPRCVEYQCIDQCDADQDGNPSHLCGGDDCDDDGDLFIDNHPDCDLADEGLPRDCDDRNARVHPGLSCSGYTSCGEMRSAFGLEDQFSAINRLSVSLSAVPATPPSFGLPSGFSPPAAPFSLVAKNIGSWEYAYLQDRPELSEEYNRVVLLSTSYTEDQRPRFVSEEMLRTDDLEGSFSRYRDLRSARFRSADGRDIHALAIAGHDNDDHERVTLYQRNETSWDVLATTPSSRPEYPALFTPLALSYRQNQGVRVFWRERFEEAGSERGLVGFLASAVRFSSPHRDDQCSSHSIRIFNQCQQRCCDRRHSGRVHTVGP